MSATVMSVQSRAMKWAESGLDPIVSKNYGYRYQKLTQRELYIFINHV